jgi:hypothetical protein
MRKASHERLNPHAAEAYRLLQEKEAAVLVDNMLNDPDSWSDHLKRSVLYVYVSFWVVHLTATAL